MIHFHYFGFSLLNFAVEYFYTTINFKHYFYIKVMKKHGCALFSLSQLGSSANTV